MSFNTDDKQSNQCKFSEPSRLYQQLLRGTVSIPVESSVSSVTSSSSSPSPLAFVPVSSPPAAEGVAAHAYGETTVEEQTHALDLTINFSYPAKGFPTPGSGFCEWCRQPTSTANESPHFCRETCFEAYRRSHYKRRSFCAICGERGEWEVPSVGDLKPLRERICQSCTAVSIRKVFKMDNGEDRPPITTTPTVSSSIPVTTISFVPTNGSMQPRIPSRPIPYRSGQIGRTLRVAPSPSFIPRYGERSGWFCPIPTSNIRSNHNTQQEHNQSILATANNPFLQRSAAVGGLGSLGRDSDSSSSSPERPSSTEEQNSEVLPEPRRFSVRPFPLGPVRPTPMHGVPELSQPLPPLSHHVPDVPMVSSTSTSAAEFGRGQLTEMLPSVGNHGRNQGHSNVENSQLGLNEAANQPPESELRRLQMNQFQSLQHRDVYQRSITPPRVRYGHETPLTIEIPTFKNIQTPPEVSSYELLKKAKIDPSGRCLNTSGGFSVVQNSIIQTPNESGILGYYSGSTMTPSGSVPTSNQTPTSAGVSRVETSSGGLMHRNCCGATTQWTFARMNSDGSIIQDDNATDRQNLPTLPVGPRSSQNTPPQVAESFQPTGFRLAQNTREEIQRHERIPEGLAMRYSHSNRALEPAHTFNSEPFSCRYQRMAYPPEGDDQVTKPASQSVSFSATATPASTAAMTTVSSAYAPIFSTASPPSPTTDSSFVARALASMGVSTPPETSGRTQRRGRKEEHAVSEPKRNNSKGGKSSQKGKSGALNRKSAKHSAEKNQERAQKKERRTKKKEQVREYGGVIHSRLTFQVSSSLPGSSASMFGNVSSVPPRETSSQVSGPTPTTSTATTTQSIIQRWANIIPDPLALPIILPVPIFIPVPVPFPAPYFANKKEANQNGTTSVENNGAVEASHDESLEQQINEPNQTERREDNSNRIADAEIQQILQLISPNNPHAHPVVVEREEMVRSHDSGVENENYEDESNGSDGVDVI